MKRLSVRDAVEIVGAVSIVLTLMFLALEIKQSNDVASYTAARELHDSFNQINLILAGDPTLAELWFRMNSEDANFSQSEQARIEAVARLLFNVWGSVHEAYESNLINEELYESMSKDVFVQMQAAPAAIPIWVEMIKDYPDRQSHPILAPIEARRRAGQATSSPRN